MKTSSFRHYKLNQASRQTTSIQRFGGVDYSTQKFLISSGRAIDLKNFVYKDGIVQKRNGVEEIFAIADFHYIPADFSNNTSPLLEEVHNNLGKKTINGIWKFVAEDKQEHIVAHIGKLMYEIKNIGSRDFITCEPITFGTASAEGQQRNLAYEFEDFKSFAYVGGNKLWFQGGNKYMLLRFTNSGVIFTPVEDSDFTPVPTTTISITCKNAMVGNRNSLDKVNLLTEWRKNKLISGVPKKEDEKTRTLFYEYTLDAPLVAKTTKDFGKIRMTIEESGVIK